MYKIDFSDLDSQNTKISGVLIEEPNLILDKEHPCVGFGWIHIRGDSDDKECEVVIGTKEILKFCTQNREKLKIGGRIKMKGMCIKRDKMDYLYLDEEGSIEIEPVN